MPKVRYLVDPVGDDLFLPGLDPGLQSVGNGVGIFAAEGPKGCEPDVEILRGYGRNESILGLQKILKILVPLDSTDLKACRLGEVLLCFGEYIHVDVPPAK